MTVKGGADRQSHRLRAQIGWAKSGAGTKKPPPAGADGAALIDLVYAYFTP